MAPLLHRAAIIRSPSKGQKGIYISYSFLPRYRQLDDLDPLTHQVQVQVHLVNFSLFTNKVTCYY